MKYWLRNIDDLVATMALSGVILLTIVNVISRYAFNSPLPWAQELSIAMFIWFIYIGVSSTMKRDGHVGVDFVILLLPRPLRIVGEIIRAVAIYFALIYVFIYLGARLTAQAQNKITPILGIGYDIIDVAVPLGGVLATIHFTGSLIWKYKNVYRISKEG